MNKLHNTVNDYIADFPSAIQIILEQIRVTIQTAAPEAEESISYGMPAYKLNKKPLVYFAAHKNHIGFYPTPSGVSAFKEELSSYKTSKGAVQFPLDKPLPLDLITKIVKFRLKSNLEKVKQKR